MSSTEVKKNVTVFGEMCQLKKNHKNKRGGCSPAYMCRLNAAQQRQGLTFLLLTFVLIKWLPKQLLLPPLLPTLVLIRRGANYTQLFLQSIKGSLVVGRSQRWLLFTGEAALGRSSVSSVTPLPLQPPLSAHQGLKQERSEAKSRRRGC